MARKRRLPPARLVRRIGDVVVVAVLAALMVAATPVPAPAAPAADPATQISQDNDQLESIIEEYDRVNSLLAVDQAKAAALGAKVRQLDRKVGLARARLQPDIRRAYEIGTVSTLRLLIDTTSTADLVDQLNMAEGIAYQQRAQIRSLTAARNKARAAKKSLDATVARLASRKADLAARKRTILADIAAQQEIEKHLPAGELNDPSPLRPVPCPYTAATGAAAIAVRVACDQIGKPYVWAAAGPNTFDCSGLMVYAWGIAGKKLRHYTGWQWADGTPISAAQLRPGDLVFYFPPTLHHVAMYVGGGWVVNAPHTGDVVRMARITRWPIAGYRRP